MVNEIIERLGITHVLDYGCGANTSLAKGLKSLHKLTYQAYDPGVPRFSAPPVPSQLVVCCDVLEHIEPDYLEAVLDDLKRLTQGVVLLTVSTVPAMKTLSDGRNAHLIQEPMKWWMPKIFDRWDVQSVMNLGNCFVVVGYAISTIEKPDGSLS